SRSCCNTFCFTFFSCCVLSCKTFFFSAFCFFFCFSSCCTFCFHAFLFRPTRRSSDLISSRCSAPTAPAPTPSLRDGRSMTSPSRSEEHTSELQSRFDLVCRLLLGKKNPQRDIITVEYVRCMQMTGMRAYSSSESLLSS